MKNQIHHHSLKLFIFFSLLLQFSVSADTKRTLEELKNLQSSEEPIRKKASEYLIKNEESSLPIIYKHFNPEFKQLVKDLAHDRYERREFATRTLIRIGKKNIKELEQLAQSTDPEVKIRSKRILKAIKNNDASKGDDKAFQAVVPVIIQCNSNNKQNKPFLKSYFENYKKFDKKEKRLLEKALIKASKFKDLNNVVISFGTTLPFDNSFDKFIGLIDKAYGDKAISLKKQILSTRMEQKINVSPYVDEIKSWRSFGNGTYRKMANEIRKEINSDIEYNAFARKIFKDQSLKVNALGVFMVRKNAQPFEKPIIAVIKRINNRNEGDQFFWGLEEIEDKSFLKKHIDTFLECPNWDAIEFAIKLIDNPKNYEDKLMELMFNKTNRGSDKIVKFLIEKFPKKKEQLLKRLIDYTKKQEDYNGLWSCARMLSDGFKYKGNDFDQWWEEQAKNPDSQLKKNNVLLRVAEKLNVKPKIVTKYLDFSQHVPDKYIEEAMKNATPAERDKLADKLFKYLKSIHGRYSRTNEILITYCPERTDEVIKSYLQSREKNADAEYFPRKDDVILKKIKEKPELIKHYEKYLKSDNVRMQLYAASMMFKAGFKKEKYMPVVLEIAQNIPSKKAALTLIQIMSSNESDNKHMLPVAKYYMKGDDHYFRDVRTLICCFEKPDDDVVDFFTTKAKENSDKDWAIILCEGLLIMNPEDQNIIDFLSDIAKNGQNIENAANALEVLGKFEKEPTLTQSRLEEMLKYGIDNNDLYSIIMGLKTCPNILEQMIPVFRKYLKQISKQSWPYLDFAMDASPALAKAITVDLIKMIENGTEKEKDFAAATLSGSIPEVFVPHLKSFKPIFVKQKSMETWRCLVWLFARIGLPASDYAPLIENKMKDLDGKDKHYALFALSCIHPDKNTRKKYMNQLFNEITTKKKELNYNQIRMLSLIKEFPETTHPYLASIITSEKPIDFSETCWGIMRVKPISKWGKEAYIKILSNPDQHSKYDINTIFETLVKSPESAIEILPVIEKLPKTYKMNFDYHDMMRNINRVKSKK